MIKRVSLVHGVRLIMARYKSYDKPKKYQMKPLPGEHWVLWAGIVTGLVFGLMYVFAHPIHASSFRCGTDNTCIFQHVYLASGLKVAGMMLLGYLLSSLVLFILHMMRYSQQAMVAAARAHMPSAPTPAIVMAPSLGGETPTQTPHLHALREHVQRNNTMRSSVVIPTSSAPPHHTSVDEPVDEKAVESPVPEITLSTPFIQEAPTGIQFVSDLPLPSMTDSPLPPEHTLPPAPVHPEAELPVTAPEQPQLPVNVVIVSELPPTREARYGRKRQTDRL